MSWERKLVNLEVLIISLLQNITSIYSSSVSMTDGALYMKFLMLEIMIFKGKILHFIDNYSHHNSINEGQRHKP